MGNHLNEQGGVRKEEGSITPDSPEWLLVKNANIDQYDLELYVHALELLVSQGTTMFGRPHVDNNGTVVDFGKLAIEAVELRKKLSQPHILFIDDESGEERIVSLVKDITGGNLDLIQDGEEGEGGESVPKLTAWEEMQQKKAKMIEEENERFAARTKTY